jgi:hypothetical protein
MQFYKQSIFLLLSLAYISRGVVTLEQTQHEYIKFPNKPLDKKTILLKEDNTLRVKRIITAGMVCLY